MDFLTSATITHPSGETTRYYTGGAENGTPVIFIHGWPDQAQLWHHQLRHFTSSPSLSSKYRVYALDMRGYGDSSAPKSTSSYSMEALVPELVDFTTQLNIKAAIWIGHDWGAALVSSLAAHHPALVQGMALLCIAYRTIELGLAHTLTLVNRELYPPAEFPYAQWAYMARYHQDPAGSVAALEAADVAKWTKAIYLKHDPAKHGELASTTYTLKAGWFGGKPESLPDIPLEMTSLDEELYAAQLESHRRHGWGPATAWYLNHKANAAYSESEVNAGVLDVPVLYIDARHDAVCSISTTPGMATGMRASVRDLTVEEVESAHWVMLEKPEAVNGALEGWLGKKFGGK